MKKMYTITAFKKEQIDFGIKISPTHVILPDRDNVFETELEALDFIKQNFVAMASLSTNPGANLVYFGNQLLGFSVTEIYTDK